MGVAGSGKTTVGRALAGRLGAEFLEGDDFHPPTNVAKMAAGIALDDEDRAPWLAELVGALSARTDVVLACSALRRSYRDVLRGAGHVTFLYLAVSPEEAEHRVAHRRGHYMGPDMVASQFATLEAPAADETDVRTVDASGPADEVLERLLAAYSSMS